MFEGVLARSLFPRFQTGATPVGLIEVNLSDSDESDESSDDEKQLTAWRRRNTAKYFGFNPNAPGVSVEHVG